MNNTQDKKVVFLLNTEYGLLIALLYYYEILKKNNYNPVFIFLKTNENRFRNISFSELPGEYKVYKNELNTWKLTPDLLFLESLKFRDVVEIVINNPAFYTNQIYINSYKANNPNLKLTLLADSVGIDRKITKKDIFKFFIQLCIRKYYNRIKNLNYIYVDYHNIQSYVDSFIAHRNINIKNFIDSNTLIQNIKIYVNQIFSIYNVKLKDYENSDMLFYTQPIMLVSTIPDNEKIKYIEILENISRMSLKYKKKVLLKIHPAENNEFYKIYTHEFLKIDQNPNIPAEILVNSIRNKLMISVYSSASSFDINKQNTHYWLYKILSGKEPFIHESYNYIESINSYDELETIIFKS